MSPTTHAVILAAGGGGNAAGLNFSGINMILGLVAGVVIMVAGIAISNRGKKGNFKQAADSGGAVLVGVVIFAIGAAFTVASGAAENAVTFFLGA